MKMLAGIVRPNWLIQGSEMAETKENAAARRRLHLCEIIAEPTEVSDIDVLFLQELVRALTCSPESAQHAKECLWPVMGRNCHNAMIVECRIGAI